MTTRDRRKNRGRGRTLPSGEFSQSDIPNFSEEGIQHNERVMREAQEKDRREGVKTFRREKHQQIPTGTKQPGNTGILYNNPEGIKHNKEVIRQTVERDRAEGVPPQLTDEEIAKRHNARNELQKFLDMLKEKL